MAERKNFLNILEDVYLRMAKGNGDPKKVKIESKSTPNGKDCGLNPYQTDGIATGTTFTCLREKPFCNNDAKCENTKPGGRRNNSDFDYKS